MELTFAAGTDVGKQRSTNEDSYLVDDELHLFVVADGMGGHAAGEIASSIAVRQIRDTVRENRDVIQRFAVPRSNVDSIEILQILEHAIQTACSTVYNRAQSESEKRGMGTTASALLIAGPPGRLRGFIAHVGDSRIYLSRQNQCHQLTEDHSLQNELVRRGKLRQEEFDSSPYKRYKNAVTRAVGIYASVEVDTFDFDILPGDQYLMCSDGLYSYLDEETLPNLLSAKDVEKMPAELIHIANENGGHDNITSIIVRVQEASQTDDVHAQELAQKLEILRSMQMFRYLSYKERVRILNISKTHHFLANASIFQEHDVGENMFVILEGRVRLHRGDVTMAEMGKGQHFGEMSLVDRSARSLGATALEKTRLMAIERKDFYSIIKREPILATKLLWSFVQVLADRLRKTTTDLSGALQLGQEEKTEENFIQDLFEE